MLPLQVHQFKAMGSRCELKFYADPDNCVELFAAAYGRLLELEKKYSRYREGSVTSRINRSAGKDAVVVDEETAALLDYANVLYEQSEGLFDITSGILRRLWDFRSGCLPKKEEIKALLPLIDWSKVEWKSPNFRLPLEKMEIDFGGFVKEYAADQVAAVLRKQGVQHGLVNLGGDICVIGPHPDGAPWIVGIQHPRKADEAIAQLPVVKGAVATSGDYERYMIVDDIRYCHLLNPKSGWPVQPSNASVTVLADQCLISGSFSTIALLKGDSDPTWLSESGVAYLVVDQNLNIYQNIEEP